MALTAGTRLGPYEIQAALGAGGMGEVYKARDTRLDRTVAIKILPEALAGNEQFRERFDREARTISQLDDPHICALYDVGADRGVSYLVMQYLEGETLAARLLKGPLAISEALKIGIEIAKALERAHRAGVVHRDLKPGNVMLTRSGTKLLDFGLAKATVVARGAPSILPTTPVSLTAQGTILGTFQYMAPEQIEGHDADARTDLFAFGAVAFEMVTGRPAFYGQTQASLIGSILRDDPMLTSDAASTVPTAFARVIRTCLAKNPDDRLQTAHDLALQLQWILEGGSQAHVSAPTPVTNRGRGGRWAPWALAAVTTTVAAAVTVAALLRPAASSPTIRFGVSTPDSVVSTGAPRLSPDGRYLAFNATEADGRTGVWIRKLSALTAERLAGSDGASRPFWSPDSRFVAFMADGKLKKIDVNGGPPQKICDAPTGADGSWSNSGVILYDGRLTDGIQRVSAAGGTPAVVLKPDASRKELAIGWPEFLPDGRHFLYVAVTPNPEENSYRIGALDSSDTQPLMLSQSQASFVPPDHLLFVRDGTLMEQMFDVKTLRITGEVQPLVEHISADPSGLALFSASSGGLLAYRTGESGSRLVFVDREGKELENVGEAMEFSAPVFSRDGGRIAYNRIDPRTGKGDIWIRDLARSVNSRFTFGPGDNLWPVWAPDGGRVVFQSSRSNSGDLFEKPSNGQGDEIPLLTSDQPKMPTDWSRDGRYLAYQSRDPKNKTDLWVLPLFGERKPIPVAATPAAETSPMFSPDGRFVAYRSDESGSNEIYVQTFPAAGGKWQVSNHGGNDPVWRADGKELFYRGPDQRIMSVEIRSGAGFQMSVPRALFVAHLQATGSTRNRFTATADGQRFLIVASPGREAIVPTTMVLNWTADLKR